MDVKLLFQILMWIDLVSFKCSVWFINPANQAQRTATENNIYKQGRFSWFELFWVACGLNDVVYI